MTTSRRPALIVSFLVALSMRALAAGPALPALPATPASLAVAVNERPGLVLAAKGVQIYECRAVQGDPTKYEWAFKAPEADLFDDLGQKVGRHYAGPTWELTDGSKVVGRLKAKADAPDGKGIPWLLLEAAETHGSGVMIKIHSIQRVATVGGMPPTETADQGKLGQERRVEYSATYVFYGVDL